MPTIAEVRAQYPDYSDMSDAALASALHSKFYADMPQDEFNAKIGLSAPKAESGPSMADRLISTAKGAAFGPVGVALSGLPAPSARLGRALQASWESPAPGGILGAVKNLVTLPGDAYTGKLDMNAALQPREAVTDIPPPQEHGPGTTPGLFGNTFFRPAPAEPSDNLIGRSLEAAAALPAAQLPGGIFAAPRGALGMGPSRPGVAGPIEAAAINPSAAAVDKFATEIAADFIGKAGGDKAAAIQNLEQMIRQNSRDPAYYAGHDATNSPPFRALEMMRQDAGMGPSTVQPPGAAGGGAGRQPPGGAAPPPPPGPPPPVGPDEVVAAATRQGVPIPRYMVSPSRADQGLAAGLQNMPLAGDKIAAAAHATQTALGSGLERAQAGFGIGAPEYAGARAKDALAAWVTEGSPRVANRIYDSVDALVNPGVKTELSATAALAKELTDARAASKIPGSSAAVNIVKDAIETPGGMTYSQIKGLRSYLGELTPPEMVAQGLKRAEVKRLYGALTQDLETAVENAGAHVGGNPAVAAFQKANSVFEKIQARRDAVAKIIGVSADVAPEQVFSRLSAMAGSRSNADIGALMQARKAMGAQAWNEVTAGVIAKLGRDPSGEFSVKRFLGPNGWGGLSPQGRNALFYSTGKDEVGNSLDDIALVTREIEKKLLQFYNPSGTAKSLIASETVKGVIHTPIRLLAGTIGGARLARVLSEPATAEGLASWTNAYRDAIVAPSAGKSRATQDAARQLADIITEQSGGNGESAAALAARLNAATVFPPPQGTLKSGPERPK